ncbi:MAG: hypothetical protein QXO65_03470 [Candidatus Aenigmatarchaeota archaeon]
MRKIHKIFLAYAFGLVILSFIFGLVDSLVFGASLLSFPYAFVGYIFIFFLYLFIPTVIITIPIYFIYKKLKYKNSK